MAKTTTDDYISASEIGEYLYCQRAWWLQRIGVENSKPDVLTQGTMKHEALQRQVQNTERSAHWGTRLLLLGIAIFLLIVAIKLLGGLI